MLTSLVLIIHIIVCIALILIILLQSGKGADIGAVFGGGSSQTLFGSTGATPFLSKVTIAAAVIFMCTSIILTFWGRGGGMSVERSLMTEQPGTGAPAESGTAVPPAQTPAPGGEKKEGAPGAAVPTPEGSAPSAAPSGGESKAAPSTGQPAPAAPGTGQQPAPSEGGAKAPETK